MTVGILIGHFEPLHSGHLQDINQAVALVEHLHIVITPRSTPHPKFAATLQDKARWVQVACQHFDFVSVHTTDSLNLNDFDMNDSYDTTLHIKPKLLEKLAIVHADAVFFVQPQTQIINHTNLMTQTLACHAFDSTAIFCQPIYHFHSLAPTARAHYTQTVCIVGGESSGKTTLVHKLANHFGATYALEMGRLYVHNNLGGTEIGLQYSDYPHIAIQHHQAINQARQHATAPIVIVDTDFVTTQAFCETYEGKSHPFLNSCIDSFKMDYTILLTSNVPWVADGMRSLGTDDKRKAFYQKLQHIMSKHHITTHVIDDNNYHQRYLQAVDFIHQTVLKDN